MYKERGIHHLLYYIVIAFCNYKIEVKILLWYETKKQKKRHYKKIKLKCSELHKYRHKNPQQNAGKPNPTTYENGFSYDQVVFIQGMEKCIQHMKINQCNIPEK